MIIKRLSLVVDEMLCVFSVCRLLNFNKLKYVVKETQKFVSICKYGKRRKKPKEKGLKNIPSELG